MRGCRGRGALTRWFRSEQTNANNFTCFMIQVLHMTKTFHEELKSSHQYVFAFPGFQAMRSQLRLPHFGQCLPHTQVLMHSTPPQGLLVNNMSSSHMTLYLQTWHQNEEDPPLRPGHEEDQRPEHTHQEQDLPPGFQLSSFSFPFTYF